MRRKLQQQKNKSYTISLPKAWIDKHKLQHKDELHVVDYDDHLLISKKEHNKPHSKKEITIHDRYTESDIRTILSALYREGHKEIRLHLRHKDPRLISRIYDYASSFFGVTVTTVRGNTLVISDINEENECHVTLKKCFLNVLRMSSHLDIAPKNKKWEQELVEMYKQIYFLTELVFRLIRIESQVKPVPVIRTYIMAYSLQWLAELMRRLCEHHGKITKKITFELHSFLKCVYNLCYKKQDIAEFNRIKNNALKKLDLSEYPHINEDIFVIHRVCLKLVMQVMVE
ncbi:AbrB/MazE/SpoVT family DNA-binding domain-containing protein [Fibrobacterota bacterium]